MYINYNNITINNISILSWNILADCYCDNNSFPNVNKKYLELNERISKIITIIKKIDADIVCLQEVDIFDELKLDDYNKYYKKKENSEDGILILLKDTIKINEYNIIDYYNNSEMKNYNQFFFHFNLSDNNNNSNFNLIITHLKVKIEFSNDRTSQLSQLTNFLKNNNFNNVIICGDFNCNLNDNYLIDFINNNKLNKIDNDITTFKIRNNIKKIEEIDFIFYKNIKVISQNNIYKLDLFDYDTGLPDNNMPSDHLPIFMNFKIL